jgi:hypothetical protein
MEGEKSPTNDKHIHTHMYLKKRDCGSRCTLGVGTNNIESAPTRVHPLSSCAFKRDKRHALSTTSSAVHGATQECMRDGTRSCGR